MPDYYISHMGLSCRDPLVIEDFYCRHFGFKRARVFNPGPDQIVMLKAGDTYLELFKSKEESPVKPPVGAGQNYSGWRHICFMVDDLDEKLKEMDAAAWITTGPLDLGGFVPGMKAVWLTDPEGNIVELSEGYKDDERLF